MLSDRLRIILIYVPIILAAVYLGGIVYMLAVVLLFGVAALEYLALFRSGGYPLSPYPIMGGITLLLAARHFYQFDYLPPLLSALILLCLVYHIFEYERGQEKSVMNFVISLSGMVYLGWIGAYFISLRGLPNGLWLTLVTLGAVWGADSFAYLIGSRWGRHKLSPRLSPKKSWEGYWGGLLGGPFGAVLFGGLAWAWLDPASGLQPPVALGFAAGLGLLLGLLTPFGDLGISLIKRSFHVKDSGNALGGHGGFLDRIDSWLWAAVLGYYAASWLL